MHWIVPLEHGANEFGTKFGPSDGFLQKLSFTSKTTSKNEKCRF